jgi:hypothetical protein
MRPNTVCTAMFYVTSVMASTRSSAVVGTIGSFYRSMVWVRFIEPREGRREMRSARHLCNRRESIRGEG